MSLSTWDLVTNRSVWIKKKKSCEIMVVNLQWCMYVLNRVKHVWIGSLFTDLSVFYQSHPSGHWQPYLRVSLWGISGLGSEDTRWHIFHGLKCLNLKATFKLERPNGILKMLAAPVAKLIPSQMLSYSTLFYFIHWHPPSPQELLLLLVVSNLHKTSCRDSSHSHSHSSWQTDLPCQCPCVLLVGFLVAR